MRKLISITFTTLLTFASCSNEDLFEGNIQNSISAKFEQKTSSSRLAISDNNALSWTNGDSFLLFGEGATYLYKTESTGAVATFTGAALANGKYSGAVYPVTEGTSGNPSYEDGTLSITLLSELNQKVEGNCNLPMWASVNSLQEGIEFKHLAGVLRVNLTDIPEGYNNLTINASNPIAGTFTANVNETNPVLSTNSGENTIKVIFTAATNDDKDASLYIPLPVGQYATISVSVSKDGNDSQQLVTWSNKTVARAKIYTASLSFQDIEANTPSENSVIIENKELSDALLKLYGQDYNITINSDDYAVMEKDEVLAITELDLNAYQWDYEGSITTLNGIEEFKNLRYLKCNNDALVECDLSQNASLEIVGIRGSANLIALDFSNNPNITDLYLNGNNGLASLNLTGCNKLSNLQLFGSNLTSVDIPNKEAMTNLLFGGTLILDPEDFPNLTGLGCEDMNLTNLNLIPAEMKGQLTFLSCEYNNLSSLDLEDYPNLECLKCGANQLTTLDLSVIPNVTQVDCYENQIESLDISMLNHLKSIACGRQKNNINLNLSLTQTQYDNWDSLNGWANENVTLNIITTE